MQKCECDYDYTCISCMIGAGEPEPAAAEDDSTPCEVITVDFINKKRVA